MTAGPGDMKMLHKSLRVFFSLAFCSGELEMDVHFSFPKHAHDATGLISLCYHK